LAPRKRRDRTADRSLLRRCREHKEFVTEGLDSAPAAFMGLLKGANFGKQLVRVGPDKA
jgi:NADPH-dependent curcumin reductase CurA